MIDKIDIKSFADKIVNMCFRDVGYGELRNYIYNTTRDFVIKAYEQGGKDKEELLRDIRKKQEQIINKKFKELLDEFN